MSDKVEIFAKAFADGLPYEEAAALAGMPESDMLAEYWNILVMEAAVAKASTYFDQLLELAS
jgi:hypothetical protein